MDIACRHRRWEIEVIRMELELYLALSTLLVVVIFHRSLLTYFGKKLINLDVKKRLDTAQFVKRRVVLPNQREAWYLEREPNVAQPEPTLLVLPGATMEMDFMGSRLSGLVRRLPNRRIIVLELPHHGRNAVQDLALNVPAKSVKAMAEYVHHFQKAVHLPESFDLMGYSLGGGIAAHYAVQYPQYLRKLILLAPYFHETATDAFLAVIESESWQQVHGWQTLEEMRHFFNEWLGMAKSDTPPEFVMQAIHAQRLDNYPSGYWSKLLKSLYEASRPSHTFLVENSDNLAAFQRPTLLLRAVDDTVCDPQKLNRLAEIFGHEVCTICSVPSGHAFGAKGRTLFSLSKDAISKFLRG